ncbi:MAG: UDP-N-acetylmuramoyl-L-alanyl-D-glutamate--2,6-diaminopimelate ligase [Puniceicoccales bacterium]|nr:UDP-N-acetylmuramoyl-L-alanyl-D-glutamate--2,6-diaminopimelate ligase [Puniceicoccales bacterium]
MKTIEQLFDGVECATDRVHYDAPIDCISHDSREITAVGYPLFFAIKGMHCDANSCVDAVTNINKNTIIASETFHRNGITVSKLNEAMAIVARKFYDFPDGKMNIVAVTGTNGKSTVGFLLKQLLSRCGLFGTIEYDLCGQILAATNTTPLALDFYKLLSKCEQNGCENVVLEASSHALDQKRIFGLAISIAIFTNLSHEHLDFHSTLENYFLAKKKLFTGENGAMPEIGLINIDDQYGRRLFNDLRMSGQQIYSFGFSHEADFHIADIKKNSLAGSAFTLRHKNRSHSFGTKLFGKHNISNATACLAAARLLGYNFDQLRSKLATCVGAPGRLDGVPLKTEAMAFVDYAHTPDALQMVLSTLVKQPHKRIITVFGCGGERDRAKRAPMAKIATVMSDYTIITADNTRGEPLEQIFSDMRPGIANSGTVIEFISDRYTAIERAVKLSQKGDIVLVSGRGHENDHKIGNQIIHLNDKEALKEISGRL